MSLHANQMNIKVATFNEWLEQKKKEIESLEAHINQIHESLLRHKEKVQPPTDWLKWFHLWKRAKATRDHEEPTTKQIKMIPVLKSVLFEDGPCSASHDANAPDGKIVMINTVRLERGPDAVRKGICEGTLKTILNSDDLNPFSDRNTQTAKWGRECVYTTCHCTVPCPNPPNARRSCHPSAQRVKSVRAKRKS